MTVGLGMHEALRRARSRRRRNRLLLDTGFTSLLVGLVGYTAYTFLTEAGLLIALGPGGIVGLSVLWLTFHEKRRAVLGAG